MPASRAPLRRRDREAHAGRPHDGVLPPLPGPRAGCADVFAFLSQRGRPFLRGRPGPQRAKRPELPSRAARSRPTAPSTRGATIALMRSSSSPPKSFNSKLRDELLNGEIFYTLQEAKVIIENWRRHYNPASEHPSVYVIEEKRFC